MIEILRKLWMKFNKRDNSLFEISVDKQRAFLESLPEAKDDIERSYNQYCCQMFVKGKIVSFVLNFFSLPLLIWYYFGFHTTPKTKTDFDAVAILEGKPVDIIPLELRKEFVHWYDVESYNDDGYFGQREQAFFWKLIRRYPFSWFFLLKCLIKISSYGYILKVYKPKAIIVCNEYSFTSSILTQYCELENVEHFNVMHGEKLYYIRDSFFRYHRCYVWGQMYINLFKSLKANKNNFIIAVPKSMSFSTKKINKIYDFIYFLGNEDETMIKRIASVLKKLVLLGNKVALRPHPRYTDMNLVRGIDVSITIEDCSLIDIETSILSAKHVISKYSTVLNQAYHNGVTIVIDDVTDPKGYELLTTLQYSMLLVPHKLLSDYV